MSPRGARPCWLGPSSAQMLGSACTGPATGSGTLALAWQTISWSSSTLCVNTLIRVTHVCSGRVTENSTNALGHSCLLYSFRGTSLYQNNNINLFHLDFFYVFEAKTPFPSYLCCEENLKFSVYKDKIV